MQGFNMGRYVPPDLEGTTNFNTASGKGNALGARARKLKSEGVLVVRFECPFAIWCTHCDPEQIIGQGVRFNAEKKKVGNYYSSPIWSFRFKHASCGMWIEVRTDPEHTEYVVVEGGRRRDTGSNKLLEGEMRVGVSEEDKERLEREGGFAALEKKLEDKREADMQNKRIDELVTQSEKDWSDPYEVSKRLRKDFRVGRRKRQADEKSGEVLQDKYGFSLEMVAPVEEDAEHARLIEFGKAKSASLMSKPLFDSPSGHPALTVQKDQVKQRPKATAQAAAQRSILQKTLQSNTRSVVDPFSMNRNEGVSVKRKRADDAKHESDGKSQSAEKKKNTLVLYRSDSDSDST